MNYIISDNRLHELMVNYLDGKSGSVSRIDSYLIIFDESSYDDIDYDGVLVEYDSHDGRLYINKDFLVEFHSFFPVGMDYIKEFIKEWFENRFKVDVKFVSV